jgi:septation ring formation regulator EzrA
MEDKTKDVKKSVEDMLAGLNGIVAFAEKSTKGVFENMGKVESKKFVKTMQEMQFSENILKLKKEVEGLKKTFNQFTK